MFIDGFLILSSSLLTNENVWTTDREEREKKILFYNTIDVLSVIPSDKPEKKHIVKNTFFCVKLYNVFSPHVHKMAVQYHRHSFKSINMAIEGGATYKHKKTSVK